MGHFPSRNVIEMPDIQSASRPIFSVFGLNRLPNLPACFATVADRSAMRGRAIAAG